MVGHMPLEHGILVRVQVPQQYWIFRARLLEISLFLNCIQRFGVSVVFALLIWSVGEAFGGPYVAGSTDIGAGIIYALVAAGLLIGVSWKEYSIDSIRVGKRGNVWDN